MVPAHFGRIAQPNCGVPKEKPKNPKAVNVDALQSVDFTVLKLQTMTDFQ